MKTYDSGEYACPNLLKTKASVSRRTAAQLITNIQ